MEFRISVDGVDPGQLTGFFEGWPMAPSPERHLAILQGSSHVVLAEEADEIVGFVTAISDGVLAAYIPLLEVRRDRRGRGIGTELVRRLLVELERFYMVDVICDPDVAPFYERFGMIRVTGLVRRNRSVLGDA